MLDDMELTMQLNTITDPMLLVIIPVHNEEDNLEKVIADVKKEAEVMPLRTDILIIDDGSTDMTSEIIHDAGVRHITNPVNIGYGGCLQVGYKYAVRRGYQYLIQMDGDGQHDACNIPVLYKGLCEKDTEGKTSDIVLGSRFMPGSSPYEVGALKKFAFAWFRMLIRQVTGYKDRIYDPTTGLQGLSRRAFAFYSVSGNYDPHYPDANMLTQMILLGFRIHQIPAVMHNRAGGVSMHAGLIHQAKYMIHMTLSLWAVGIRIMKFHMGVDQAKQIQQLNADELIAVTDRERYFDI